MRTWTSLAASTLDRKSTRLNSSHLVISYAVFCLKKKIRTTLSTLSSWSAPVHCYRQCSPQPVGREVWPLPWCVDFDAVASPFLSAYTPVSPLIFCRLCRVRQNGLVRLPTTDRT